MYTSSANMRASKTHFKKFITPAELKLLDEWFSQKGDNWLLTYNLMKLAGMRVSDATRVNMSWLQGEMIVYEQYKTKRINTYYMPKVFREWLYGHYIPTHKDCFKDGYLAYNDNNYSDKLGHKHLQSSSVRWEFFKFRNFYDIRDSYHTNKGRDYHRICPHALRHVAAEAVDKITGHNIKAVQEFLGHSKFETTYNYYIKGIRSYEERVYISEELLKALG